MHAIPNLEVGDLRKIADWHWDALAGVGERAAETDRYDKFLATAVFMISDGASDVQVGDYFVDVEIEHLGLDTGAGIRERAQLLARAMREYVETGEATAVG
jgi:hypothetical protein